MESFKAVFQIVENNNCQLYKTSEFLTLTDKAVSIPDGKACRLILVREMTQLLFQLLREEGKRNGADFSREYTCSGCTGIIKFVRTTEKAAAVESTVPALSDQEDTASFPPYISEENQRLFNKIVRYPLFQNIPENHLKEFINCFRVMPLEKGSLLIEKGRPIKDIFILMSGSFIVEDAGVRIASLGEGEVCGEMSYFGDNIASTSVRTIEDSEVLAISGEDFGRLIKVSDSVHGYMVRLLAKRLTNANSVRVSEFDVGMQGRVNEMTPAELLQIFHMHQKTGVLSLDLPQGPASVSFLDGAIVVANYDGKRGQDAVFAVLAEKDGVYNFTNGLPSQMMEESAIGDFMMLLMEGVRRSDEE